VSDRVNQRTRCGLGDERQKIEKMSSVSGMKYGRDKTEEGGFFQMVEATKRKSKRETVQYRAAYI